MPWGAKAAHKTSAFISSDSKHPRAAAEPRFERCRITHASRDHGTVCRPQRMIAQPPHALR